MEIYKRHEQVLVDTLHKALDRMKPERLIGRYVNVNDSILTIDDCSWEISGSTNIWVFGTGKAAPRMAAAIEHLLGDFITDGIVISHDIEQVSTQKIQQFRGHHPLPSNDSVAATYELVELAKKVRPDDIVLFCVTGGSSALLSLPANSIELDDLKAVHHLLLNSGAGIHEINTVRKHLSAVKGGQMLPFFAKSRFINLVISDVPGDDPAYIGSGPTVYDDSTFEEAFQVLKKYELWPEVPQSIRTHIAKGMNGLIPETIKPDRFPNFNPHTFLIGTAKKMGQTVASLLEEKKFSVWIAEEAYDTPVKTISKKISADAVSVLSKNTPVKKPGALVYFGESKVKVTGKGLGGRNQELALSVALSVEGQHHISLMSVGTDGRDGPVDSAGAIVNASTILKARESGLDPEAFLKDNDSYHFFEKTGNHIKIGATGNNLMDLQVVLIE